MTDTLFPLRDPRVPYCEGGGGTCAVCVGSCGIEEYDLAREVALRDMTDTGERLTLEQLAESVGIDLDSVEG